MRFRIPALILLISLGMAAASRGAPPQGGTPGPTYPSGPSVAGLRLSLHSERASFELGKPIFVWIIISNVSGRDMDMSYGDVEHAARFFVMDHIGAQVAARQPGGGVIGGSRFLGAGDQRRIRVRLDRWVPVDHPGAYKVTATMDVQIGNAAHPSAVQLRSNPITVRVTR